jgi:hypothetical protein
VITYDRSTPVQVVNAAHDTSGNGGRKSVRLSNGWLVNLVRSTTGSPYTQGYFYVSKDNGANWTLLTTISGTGAPNNGMQSPFAVTSFGNNVYCIFLKGSDNQRLQFVKFDATMVGASVNSSIIDLDVQTLITSGCAITCDSSGNIYAAWCSKNATYSVSFNIRHVKSTDGGVTWTKQDGTAGVDQVTVYDDANQNCSNVSVVVASNGYPVIAFKYTYLSADLYNTIRAAYFNGASWVVVQIHSDIYLKDFPCAIVSPNGRIHMWYQSKDVTDNAKYNICHSYSDNNGVAWSASVKLTTGNTVDRITPSGAVDTNNQPYVVYNDNGTLKFIYYNGSSWSTPETIAAGTNPSVCEFSRFSKPLTLFMGASDVKFYGIWTGLEYTRAFVATALASTIFESHKTYIRAFVAQVSASVTVSKRVNKILTAITHVLAQMKRSSKYKPVYPKLSFIEYPIEMSVTEYPIRVEVLGMPKAGSTITLKGTFPDSAGNLALLTDITVKIYGPGRILLTTITDVTEVSVGNYTAEYTIPADTIGQFDFEFSGTLGSKTIIGRSSFDSIWK